MSRVLPQALKTQKVNSLPSDLKKIAEELLADKFDIPEEVVERKAPDPFRGMDEFDRRLFVGDFTRPSFRDERGRGRVRVDTDFQTGQRVASATISGSAIDGIAEAMSSLDRSGFNNRNRRILIGQHRMEYLKRECLDIYWDTRKMLPTLWGAELIVVGPGMREQIEQII